MTIGQMLQKQKGDFNSIKINYTDENRILWHIQLPFETLKDCDTLMQCGYRTFDESHCGEKNTGIFGVVNNDLPEDITQKLDFIFPKTLQPERKSDSESDEITVRDCIRTYNNVNRIAFSLNTTIGRWYADIVNVQELFEPMNPLANFLVNNAGLSAVDSSVLNINLRTIELEGWIGQQRKERQKEQEEREKELVNYKKKPLTVFAFFLSLSICDDISRSIKMGIIGVFINICLFFCAIVFGCFLAVVFNALDEFSRTTRKKIRKQEIENRSKNKTLLMFSISFGISDFVGIFVAEYFKRSSINGILPLLGLPFGVAFSTILLFIVFCTIHEHFATAKKGIQKQKRIIDPKIWIVATGTIIVAILGGYYSLCNLTNAEFTLIFAFLGFVLSLLVSSWFGVE